MTQMLRTAMKRNVGLAWDRVTADDIEVGAAAYRNYRQTITWLADEYSVTLDRAALAFVILSPRNSLMGNLRGLATCLEARRRGIDPSEFQVQGFQKWKRRAMEALDGVIQFRHIGGTKIRAFHDNIINADRSLEICVDGHMICIATARSMSMFEALMWARSIGYETCLRMVAREIRQIAVNEELPPCTVQAILWTARKRELSIYAEEWPRNEPILPADIPLYNLPGIETA
jgi:hypothetical protein